MCNENTENEIKKNTAEAAKYFVFAAITIAVIYVVQVFRLFELLFQYAYRGNLSTVVYCIITVVCWIPAIILLYKFVLKTTGYKLFNRKNPPISFKRACIIYGSVLLSVLIISISLGFQFKVVYELNKNLMQLHIIKNAVLYAQGSAELILAVIALELVQEGAELLYKGKGAKYIPWGGIALAITYGIGEVIVAYLTGGSIIFAWLMIAFCVLLGEIYLIGHKSFSVTLLCAILIYIL